ncbi:extracellular solute-binding protein [Cypionkella sp.]|uniref:ABC transporter substrate-binding protein n=1 Tax=Cypionkella sp. TaxID=2811411 RepID=UPI00260CCFCF|nr:extracellular solute-binding protein [Cypionkella sp.]
MWNEPEPQAVALRAIMDAYTAAHPETTFSAVWNGRANQTKLRSALQAGTKVDLMDQDGDQLIGGLQKQGLALQLDGLVKADFGASLLPGVFDIYASEGKHYQVPYVYNSVNFWYNKEILEEAGAQEPATFDELLAMCDAVRKLDKYALVVDNDDTYALYYFSYLLERKLGVNALVTTFEDKTGESWLKPEVLKAAQMAQSLWGRCIPDDARGFQYPAGQQTVALGDSMGNLNGSWLPAELSSSAGEDFPWGAFNFPSVEGGKGKQTDLQVALLSMIALESSEHKEEAVDFLEFLVSEEAQKIIVEQGSVGSTRAGVAWPAILEEAYQAATNATAISNIYGGVGINYPDFYTTILAPEQNKMFMGQTEAKAFVEAMAADTKKYWEAK